MTGTINRRICAEVDGDFVLFLIGIRINRVLSARRWWPILSAMPKMLRELDAQPDLGLMHHRTHFGLRNTMMVQYWRSHEQLQAYATASDAAHLPAWRAFNRAVGTSGDVGIWHETYVIGAGRTENIYVNMPLHGLGHVGRIEEAQGKRAKAEGRLRANAAPQP